MCSAAILINNLSMIHIVFPVWSETNWHKSSASLNSSERCLSPYLSLQGCNRTCCEIRKHCLDLFSGSAGPLWLTLSLCGIQHSLSSLALTVSNMPVPSCLHHWWHCRLQAMFTSVKENQITSFILFFSVSLPQNARIHWQECSSCLAPGVKLIVCSLRRPQRGEKE